MTNATLPTWATLVKKGRVEIDPDGYFPAFLSELGINKDDADQHALTVCTQCAKWDVLRSLAGTNDAAQNGGATVILIKNRPVWALSQFKAKGASGKTVEDATKGGAAKAHYLRIRPSIF